MEKRNDDQIIYVKDLLFTALYRWRGILIAAVIFAVLLGGFMLYSGIQSLRSANTTVPQEQLESYEKEVAVLENQVERMEKSIADQERYLQESILMNASTSDLYNLSIDLYIHPQTLIVNKDSEDQVRDNSDLIFYSYYTALTDSALAEKLAEKLGIPAIYASELIEVDQAMTTTQIINTTRIINITLTHTDPQMLEDLADIVVACINDAKVKTETAVEPHQINMTREAANPGSSDSLREKKTEALELLTTQKEELTAVQDMLNAVEKPSVAVVTKSFVLKKAIILAIAGGILGAGIVACYAWFLHLAGNKVYSERVLKNQTGIRVLANVPAGAVKNPIDRWLRTLEGRSMHQAQAAVAAAAVCQYCSNDKNVLVLGNSDQSVWQGILDALKNSGINACAAGSLLTNADALAQLANYSQILLIEQCGKSRYGDISKTLRIVDDLDKQLIGCILLDG